jgi:uncharacterized protein (DUF1697 family)
MVRLVDIFESAGYTRVRTYIQSGNVVFDAPSGAKPFGISSDWGCPP